MKTMKFLLTTAVLAVGLCLAPVETKAGPNPINCTNIIDSATSISSLPTNSPGFRTGGWVEVKNQKGFGLTVQGFLVSAQSSNLITIGLVGANSANAPLVTTTNTDWMYPQIQYFDVLLGAQVGGIPFNWSTNFSSTSPAAEWSYVGVASIVARGSGIALTNVFGLATNGPNSLIMINKKIIPVSLSSGN